MTFIEEMEAIARSTDDERLAAAIYEKLLRFSTMGQKKFSVNNTKQELHLHGAQRELPDFSDLAPHRIREHIAILDAEMKSGDTDA